MYNWNSREFNILRPKNYKLLKPSHVPVNILENPT